MSGECSNRSDSKWEKQWNDIREMASRQSPHEHIGLIPPMKPKSTLPGSQLHCQLSQLNQLYAWAVLDSRRNSKLYISMSLRVMTRNFQA